MVMKEVTGKRRGGGAHKRVGVAETKAHLSELLRDLPQGPVIIHSRGRDVGVLVEIGAYERLAANDALPGGASFLAAVDLLKAEEEAPEDFAPAPAKIVPMNPFSRRRSRS